MTDATLKACPFCGQPPVERIYFEDTGAGDGRRWQTVECDKCPVLVRSTVAGPHGYPREDDPVSEDWARKEARRFWNHRHE